MKEDKKPHLVHNIVNSKFVRTISIQIVLVFLFVVVAIVAIVFSSFTSEIKSSVIAERQKQLDVIQESISQRMEEISSIAYNISEDRLFYIEAVLDNEHSGYEMTTTLERYLIGNDFIEYLSYMRLAEPEVVYTSKGELSFHDFWTTYLSFDNITEQEYLGKITGCIGNSIIPLTAGKNGRSFITFINAIPQFSSEPRAFTIFTVPMSQIEPIVKAQLYNCYGKVAIFDASGTQIYEISNLEENIDIELSSQYEENYLTEDGMEYVLQKSKAESNNWTYVSLIRLNDIISGVANQQLTFIILLLAIVLAAVLVLLLGIVTKFKPINKLALSLTEKSDDMTKGAIIDEESLLSDTFAVLKDDSNQKQHFELAYYEAEAASKAKSAFLSNMSHDIRTPMNAIVGMTEIALKHATDADYVKECLKKVRVASQYLLDIINNVLDMSRIESGKFTLSEDVIEFPKLVHGIVTILNQSVMVKSQRLIVEADNIKNEKVIGDTVRLTQVFMNILSNSVKFTPNGGTISFRMSQMKSGAEGYADYSFVFSDNGIGMSQEFVNKVFDTFTRDENSMTKKTEGTGLGMAIAKAFVELMGGSIICESERGRGTTFTVTMHMKLAEEQQKHDYAKYKTMSALLIGDETRICEKQAQLFREVGVHTDYALSIKAAIEMAKRGYSENNEFTFIIINQTEDDKSGTDTVKWLKKEVPSENTSYILAIKDLLAVDQSEAVDSGMTAFVQVPMFRSTAIGILDRTFERSHDADKKNVADLSGMNILLVEDNKLNREIACALIEETGANIIGATDGREAIDEFKSHEVGYFDVILMDVQMPVLNGYEATAAIRSISRDDAATIPIFAMTANTFDEDVRQVKEAGMNGHLGKPYVSEELYAILEKAREMNREHSSLR